MHFVLKKMILNWIMTLSTEIKLNSEISKDLLPELSKKTKWKSNLKSQSEEIES